MIAVAALGRVAPPPRALVVGVALLAAYAAWMYLSITWAEDKAIAWDGANRAAMYALVLAIFSLWPLDARGARIVLATLGLGLAGLGLVELLKANSAANPLGYFIDVRFAEPAGYINANVALWTIGLFPCLGVAAAREAHPALRALCLGGAGLLASLALLGQSRGWVLAVPLATAALAGDLAAPGARRHRRGSGDARGAGRLRADPRRARRVQRREHRRAALRRHRRDPGDGRRARGHRVRDRDRGPPPQTERPSN